VADAAVTAVIAHEHLTQRNGSPTAKENVIYNLTGSSSAQIFFPISKKPLLIT
jgi:hypothetical protein